LSAKATICSKGFVIYYFNTLSPFVSTSIQV
jgi:hypothetical protein